MLKILIPTDLSQNAFRATAYAAELFKHGPAQIFLLHAFADEVYEIKSSRKEEIFEEIKSQVYERSESALEGVKQEIFKISPNPKHQVACVSEFGMLVDAVNDWVEKENIDVVVMGTKGKTADKKLTFGSNTLQVIKYVKCPVLAIPEDYELNHPKNILFSTDFLLPYKRRELKLLGNMAKRFAAAIHFLYISEFDNLSLRQQDNKEFLSAVFSENHVHFHQHSKDGDITQSINSFISENQIDMLVLVNTRHSYLENILYQSTIEKIGLHITIPFLVMQNLPR